MSLVENKDRGNLFPGSTATTEQVERLKILTRKDLTVALKEIGLSEQVISRWISESAMEPMAALSGLAVINGVSPFELAERKWSEVAATAVSI